MLKENKKTIILASIITILPIFVGLYFWNRLPEQMGTHFGVNGEVDGYSSKTFAVFGTPILLLAVEWFCAFMTANDPKKQNISPKLFKLILWIVPIVSLFIALFLYSYNLGFNINITNAAGIFVGLIFIIIGNILPKAKHNYTVGIKIPWTLANEENWNRTHHLAGYLWVIGGIITILLSFIDATKIISILAMPIIIGIVPCIYSYILHVKHGL